MDQSSASSTRDGRRSYSFALLSNPKSLTSSETMVPKIDLTSFPSGGLNISLRCRFVFLYAPHVAQWLFSSPHLSEWSIRRR